MNKLPETVREGMNVYDRDNDKIGTVETVRFGDEAVARDDSREGYRDDGLIGNLAEAMWPDDMPDAQRAILLSNGYLVLDADGIFASDRYIQPEQIADVMADGIRLNVSRSDLAKT